MPDALRPLERYLLEGSANSTSFVRWAFKSRGAQALRALANGTLELEPTAILDFFPSAQARSFFLSLLSESGVLPELDLRQALFDHWLLHWLEDLEDKNDRILLRRYHAWGSNPITRRPTGRSTNPRGRGTRQKARLRESAKLLAHIRDEGHTVATFPQRQLDLYLNGSASQSAALAHFTRWLRENRLSTLQVATRPRRNPSTGTPEDERLRLVRRFLTDTTIPCSDRVGALLTLLFGMQATRIVQLERGAVSIVDGRMLLVVGTDPIELPTPLADLVAEHLKESESKSDRWLFPGKFPGAPLAVVTLSRRLARYGLSTGDGRNAALMALAHQMHPRVLSDLLGISSAAAARWWRTAGGDWATYPSLREPSRTAAIR